MDARKADEPKNDDLLKSIRLWRVVIAAFGALVVLGYLLKFGLKPADAQEKWGQFGDYLGGLLNPVVAFAAFYWLTQSVRLQKEELADTRKELKGATDAQRELVSNGHVQVQLAALTALANSANEELAIAANAKAALEAARNAVPIHPMAFVEPRIYEQLQSVESDIARARRKRDNYLARMEQILVAHTPLKEPEDPSAAHGTVGPA